MPTVSADDIYYVDFSSDPDFTAGSFVSYYPEGELQFEYPIRGVGSISDAISLSAIDADGLAVVSDLFIIPYEHYFRLRYGNIGIMAGPVTGVKIMEGDDFMSWSGKTWEHYMERWQYPFDPRTAHVNDFVFPNSFQNDELVGSGGVTPAGLAYQAYNRDAIRILSDILSTTMNVPNRLVFDISNLASLSGIKTNYQLSLGDTSFMDSLLSTLSGTGEGFDWWISMDRKFYWASPYRFGDTGAPSYVLSIDSSTNPKTNPPTEVGFENNGPRGTHFLGRGAGLAAQTTLGYALGSPLNQAAFTRLDSDDDFGDIRNLNQLIALTQRGLVERVQPQHNMPIQFDPSAITNFWSTIRSGRAIHLYWALPPYHTIQSGQRIMSLSGKRDANGDVLCDLTIQQIYDYSLTAGVPEG